MPRPTGSGTNANGNNYTSYDNGGYHYNNSNGKKRTKFQIFESNESLVMTLKQFLGSSYAQNGAHEHYTAPDGQTGKFAQ